MVNFKIAGLGSIPYVVTNVSALRSRLPKNHKVLCKNALFSSGKGSIPAERWAEEPLWFYLEFFCLECNLRPLCSHSYKVSIDSPQTLLA